MKRSIIEAILGAVVLTVAGVFFFFAYTSTDIRVTRGYTLTANFNAIDGLTVRSDGLLGGKYVRLEPGSAKNTLAAGGKLTNTKDVVGLEEFLGKVIFLVTDGDAGS
jgi:phospholipid/cholesterol/gamma-HCH transport system substrate-binding protein